jgi:regulator of CtrA degradation
MTANRAGARIAPKLINSLYVEAMVLADEARAYFDRHGREERLLLDPVVRVGFSVESLKVTTRLMHVIAWLLTQRAVEAGELTVVEAGSEARRLGEEPESDPAVLDRLPDGAAHLVRSSQDLFARVARLDRSQQEPVPRISPARSLLNRLERSL